ncbi:MAG TPA: dihydrofolate reductase family protein [Streptosporangiaceae bacterium]|nr:dihydrofolate reductase family protein [Streptosporangiaceae bacterium]
MRQIYPVQGPDLPAAGPAAADYLPATVDQLARLYGNGVAGGATGSPGRGWVRANMVDSVDGAVTLDGRSGGLSGPADRTVFMMLRSLADLVLVGAGTARTEHYRPVQATQVWPQLRPDRAALPPVAVVTASLDLSGCEQLLSAPPGPAQTIVITTSTASAERKAEIGRRARIVEAGADRVDIRDALGKLAGLGYLSILAEGGPRLLGQLAGASLLDELCLTTSPVLAAGSAGRIVTSPARPDDATRPRLSLAHVLTDDDFLLCRYLIRYDGYATTT